MSELRDARHILEMAERAAIDGDFSSADQLLRDAARIQEAELGPLHPDLANTLNNLAIVAEKTGRPGDAEAFYRRAVTIASAALPADHPMVAESRQNLADFCREHGVPITVAADAMTPSMQDTLLGPTPIAPEIASGTTETPIDVPAINASVNKQVRPQSGTPSPVPPAPAASQPLPAPRRSSRQLGWVAIGAIVLVTSIVFVKQPWPSRKTSTPAQAAVAPLPAEPARPAVPAVPAVPAPVEQPQPPTIAPPTDDRGVVADKPASSMPSSGAIRLDAIGLTTVQLCQSFSTNGGNWRCDPAGDLVSRGPIVLYTRVRSSRDTTVVHRWYREDILRQAVKLTIRASGSEGYRTFSRQTVNDAGNWRVEVRSVGGDLLHEQRFVVR